MSSPKARLHMLFVHSDQQPRYETVSVPAERHSNDISVAAFLVKPLSSQLGGFRCTLFVPNCSPIVSEVFPRKRDAEQDAAKKALEQMGKSFTCEDSASKATTPEQKLEALVERIEAIFSEKVIMSCQPLREHFKAAMRRKDRRAGTVPAAALAVLDNRINSLCKSLHPSSESDPFFAVAMVWEAAKRCPLVCCEDGYLIKRKATFSPQFQEEFLSRDLLESASFKFQAVHIPSSDDLMVKGIEIDLEPQVYFIDVLARELSMKEESGIIMSRTIPRAPHDTRLYCAIPDMQIQPKSFEVLVGTKLCGKNGLQFNKRASDLLGYAVYGDAILASVGSTWKSEGKLGFADVSLSCYYRLLLGRTPEGNYKLSRDAILVSKLPCSFSSRAQWRGTLPRSLLIDFCHQHRLADPEFSFFSTKASSETGSSGNEKGCNSSYKCRAKIMYEGQMMEFESEHHYRNHNDSVQSAALQGLLHLSTILSTSQVGRDFCRAEPISLDERASGISTISASANENCTSQHQGLKGSNKAQNDSHGSLATGSMVFISCDVWLVGCGLNLKVEGHEEFEFEVGVGGIITEVENVVLSMQADGCEEILLPIPNLETVLSTNEETVHNFEKSRIESCSLRYCIKVLRILEPPEDRMESALFSPPLSKQRNEFAVDKIRQLHAKSLVDFGCGSGSLLDAVVDQVTDLECIAGVDISLKSLLRAAKSLNTKLALHKGASTDHDRNKFKEVVLYEGSLAEPDPRLCGFDVATCIEVVEHMDPEPLSKAGDIILGKYAPKTLILSTPNIEYNVLLQKVAMDLKATSVDETRTSTGLDSAGLWGDPTDKSHRATLSDDESNAQPIKLRNDDHRFEWTRAEFQDWAKSMATRFGYTVQFTGVGGSVEDPGFASQIAIFTRMSLQSPQFGNCWEDRHAEQGLEVVDVQLPCYREVWKFNRAGLQQ